METSHTWRTEPHRWTQICNGRLYHVYSTCQSTNWVTLMWSNLPFQNKHTVLIRFTNESIKRSHAQSSPRRPQKHHLTIYLKLLSLPTIHDTALLTDRPKKGPKQPNQNPGKTHTSTMNLITNDSNSRLKT